MPPSKVLHVSNLPSGVMPQSVTDALVSFGPIRSVPTDVRQSVTARSFVSLIANKPQALVEFTDIQDAIKCVESGKVCCTHFTPHHPSIGTTTQNAPLTVLGRVVYANYSKSTDIKRPITQQSTHDPSFAATGPHPIQRMHCHTSAALAAAQVLTA